VTLASRVNLDIKTIPLVHFQHIKQHGLASTGSIVEKPATPLWNSHILIILSSTPKISRLLLMTMLLANSQDYPAQAYHPSLTNSHRLPTPPSDYSVMHLLGTVSPHYYDFSASSMTASSDNHTNSSNSSSSSNEVAQALEIARESPDGAKDPVISNILETALAQIWARVQAQPDAYVMSRDEFAVFNYFQHRFQGDKIAVAARRRYWDNTYGA
jgi:hypothetical protein